MDDRLHDLLITDDLSTDAREELSAALDRDRGLRDAFLRWRKIQRQLRGEIDRYIPDRELLVLYALEDLEGDLLSPEERERLAVGRSQLEEAIEAHPGLEHVVDRIREEKESFEAVWREHTADRDRRQPTRIHQLSTPWIARAAAVLAFLTLTAVAYFFVWTPGPALETVRVAEGERETIELADGSVVRVIGRSVFTYTTGASDRSTRQTQLEGRALFEVAAGEEPFVVETSSATARVLGTTFGLVSDSAETALTVAEGHVAFSGRRDASGPVVVTRGQSSRVAGAEGPSKPEAVNLTDALAWSGRLFFRDSRLETVARRLQVEYEAAVEIAPSLAHEQVTGTFDRERSLDEILDILAAALDARIERISEGGYRMLP